MSRFTGPLTITELDSDYYFWQIESPLVYEVGSLGSGREIDIPIGFQTDGASVPRLLWAILPAWGTYSRAAVVHDFLLTSLEKGTPHVEGPTRYACNDVFNEAMKVLEVNRVVRFALFSGVQFYVWWKSIWDKNFNLGK